MSHYIDYLTVENDGNVTSWMRFIKEHTIDYRRNQLFPYSMKPAKDFRTITDKIIPQNNVKKRCELIEL